MSDFGVPATALTCESFGEELIHIFHGWLCAKNLSLSDYMVGILDGGVRVPRTSSGERLGNKPSSSVLSSESYELPTINEVVEHGFSQSFIDAEWEKIYNTEQMEICVSQLGYNLPFFASLRIQDGDYSDKNQKFLK